MSIQRTLPPHSIHGTLPSAPPSSITGVFEHRPGPDGGFYLNNASGMYAILAKTPEAKAGLKSLVQSKAAMVTVEGTPTKVLDPRTETYRKAIEATAVFRAGMGEAKVTAQLLNGQSMIFLLGSEGRMPVFGASDGAKAALERFQREVGPLDTRMARLEGRLEGGAFHVTEVELLQRHPRGSALPTAR